MESFDEAYARYLKLLGLLDKTDDISEKNLLFRRLTQLLAELEQQVKSTGILLQREETDSDDWERLPPRRYLAGTGGSSVSRPEWPHQGRLRLV